MVRFQVTIGSVIRPDLLEGLPRAVSVSPSRHVQESFNP